MSEFFSERNGLIKVTEKEYSDAFRSAIVTSFFNQYNSFEEGELFERLKDAMDLFGVKQIPQVNDRAAFLRNKEQTLTYFLNCPWNNLFDFVEYVLTLDVDRADSLAKKYNQIFRMHGCKYRLVGGRVIPVVNEIEIQEISNALNTGVETVDAMYSAAITLLSERPEPDYNAVIAKTSNALESMILAIGKDNAIASDTLGRAMNELEQKGVVFDEDMKAVIKSIYTYACNAGIRHGGVETVIATEEDAILILVISAAAINYLNIIRKKLS